MCECVCGSLLSMRWPALPHGTAQLATEFGSWGLSRVPESQSTADSAVTSVHVMSAGGGGADSSQLSGG